MGLPILPPSTSLAVADEPEHVRAAFLTKLYTHLFLANSASVLALLGLTHPVPRKTLAENPLLLVPAALFWVASLAGWARTRRRATTCSISALSGALNVAAHAGEAVYFGAVLAIAINVFETFIPQLNLYPILARIAFALWSSMLGSLVAILSHSSASPIRHIGTGAAIGGVAAALATAVLNPVEWIEPVGAVVVVGAAHALLLRDLPQLMKKVGAEDAALAAHVLHSRWGHAAIQRVGGMPVEGERTPEQHVRENVKVGV